jgi:vacuolar-type H+-ATPase subunit F/Vma7
MREDDDDYVYEAESAEGLFHDFVSQRGMAFVLVARFAAETQDKEIRQLSIHMLKKIILSIQLKAPGVVVPFVKK